MTHQYTKLADALDITGKWLGGGLAATPKDIANVSEAARILRAAAGVDVAGLMKLADVVADAACEHGRLDASKMPAPIEPEINARAALESALRLALAAREGFLLVPVKPTREMLNAAIDVDSFKLGDISPIGLRCSPQKLFERCYKAMIAAAPKGTP